MQFENEYGGISNYFNITPNGILILIPFFSFLF